MTDLLFDPSLAPEPSPAQKRDRDSARRALEIWPHFAALIEVRSKAGMQSAEPSIAHLRAKYANPAAGLPPDVINQIEACFDFELASMRSADGRWLATLFYLCRSFWRVPRTNLHLRRLWKRTAVDLPAGYGASAPAHAQLRLGRKRPVR
jgi:hypothetical protein